MKIISIGRLHPIKGFDIAAEAAIALHAKYPGRFEWIVIGDGEQRGVIERTVAGHSMGDSFRLIGAKPNPYPYLAAADLLVQPSRFEGKSMVLDEARIMRKPVVATAYPSVTDRIDDGINGLVVDISSAGVAGGIARFLDDPALLAVLVAGDDGRDSEEFDDVSGFMELIA